ncbi:unnamed protein product [Urochloa humidicola]
MEAVGPSAKKQRSDKLEADKSPPPAIASREAPNPQSSAKKKRTSHSQEPAPPPGAGGGGEAGDADRISGLPDAILGDIISLLPTKDGVRTQVLASRWRHLWLAAPLNLDSDGFPAEDDDAYAGAVSRILSAHGGPGRRFRVSAHLIHRRPDTVDAWLRSPALDNLQEIDFCHRYLDPGVEEPSPPPASISRFSGSLRVVTLGKCHIPDALAGTLLFPQLKQLGIEKVHISEGALHSLISSCPALECLFVNESFGFSCLRINSSSLRSIGVGAQRYYGPEPRLQELIIEDAPCLEKLLYAEGFGSRLSVVSAPKLATLGCPTDSRGDSRILFGTTEFQELNAVSLATVMHSVKILAVNLWIFDLDKVIGLMKCFPCLEKLYMKSCNSAFENFWRRKYRLLLKSLDIRLKTVELEHYRGINGQVQFASFFVMNARELEVLRLVVKTKNYNDRFFAQQHMMLQMEKRASRGARLDFTTHICHDDLLPIKHVSDLSITDPFQCRC